MPLPKWIGHACAWEGPKLACSTVQATCFTAQTIVALMASVKGSGASVCKVGGERIAPSTRSVPTVAPITGFAKMANVCAPLDTVQ